ncbi:MAG TPA: 2-hydroxychromene-2-carboxylate isomerase, partial [Anaeromyxobacteraceae bacterium]|nr:2-hydroxychromene-2-carboxylate isomerase [Anaeromyxobacteraceae bacterium]
MATLEFFYDFVSPYSYLASTRVEAEVARVGGTVRFRPFLLGGVFNATGNKAPIETAAKGPYLAADVGRWARRLGVPYAWPAKFPVLTVLPLRAAFAAERAGQLVPFTHALFRAYWAEGKDVSDPAVVEAAATGAGLDGAALVAAAPSFKDALKAQTQEAIDRGSFGAPTFFVGNEMFIGNDRLDFA